MRATSTSILVLSMLAVAACGDDTSGSGGGGGSGRAASTSSQTGAKINAFWPQNYITDGGAASVWYDDMVLATRRSGCIRP